MKGLSSLGLIVAIIGLSLTSTPVEAKIYKCVAPGGGVSYSQSPCPTEAKVSTVLEGKSVKERFDCRVTRAFSNHVATEMKAGVSSDDLATLYGGIDAMSSTAVSVLNYVSGEIDKPDTSINQITAVSGARCESGTYAQAIDCEHYPTAFIDSKGGCAVVKGESVAVTKTKEPELDSAIPSYGTEPKTGSDHTTANPAKDKSLELKNFTVLRTTKAELQSRCRVKIKSEITAMQTKMRGHLTLEERQKMNEERYSLRQQFEDC